VLQPPKFGNFTNYRDIFRPYEIGIGAYSKVNIKGTANRHEFLIQAALLWLVHLNTKNQDYHLFILTIPL
jgi:hypothetical protein